MGGVFGWIFSLKWVGAPPIPLLIQGDGDGVG